MEYKCRGIVLRQQWMNYVGVCSGALALQGHQAIELKARDSLWLGRGCSIQHPPLPICLPTPTPGIPQRLVVWDSSHKGLSFCGCSVTSQSCQYVSHVVLWQCHQHNQQD